jgi:hypothetical protein
MDQLEDKGTASDDALAPGKKIATDDAKTGG